MSESLEPVLPDTQYVKELPDKTMQGFILKEECSGAHFQNRT